ASGAEIADGVMHVVDKRHSIIFSDLRERPVLSINRGFSAPVTLDHDQTDAEKIFLARKDPDPVARWLVLSEFVSASLIAAARRLRDGEEPEFAAELIELFGELAGDTTLEPAYRALALTLPDEDDI